MKKIVLKIVSLVLAIATVIPFLTAASCFGSDKDRTDVVYYYRNYCNSSNTIYFNGINDKGKVISNSQLGASIVGVTEVFYAKTYYGAIMEGYKCYCDVLVLVETTGGNTWSYIDTIDLGKVKKDSSGKLSLPCSTVGEIIEGKMYKNRSYKISDDGYRFEVDKKGKKSNTTCQFYYDTKKKPHLEFFYDNTGEQILGAAVSTVVAVGLVAAAFYAMDYYAVEESLAHEFQLGMNSITISALAFGNKDITKNKAKSSDKLFDINHASSGGAKIYCGYKDTCGTENRNWYKYENESVN